MKQVTIFLIGFIFFQASCSSQNFFVGWANLGTRFNPDKQKYENANHDIISPGYELQVGYQISDKLVITSGATYQSLFFKTPIENEIYSPTTLYSLFYRDISIPILLRYNFSEINSSYHLGFTSGLYFSFPLHALETIDDKISGGGGYRARDISSYVPARYNFAYAGLGCFKTVTPKIEIYA